MSTNAAGLFNGNGWSRPPRAALSNCSKPMYSHPVRVSPFQRADLGSWRFIAKNVGHDYGGHRRKRLAMVPVLGEDSLFRADSIVRLGSTEEICGVRTGTFC